MNEGVCSLTESSYECNCLPGYTGLNCESITPPLCDPNPCSLGAMCIEDTANNTYSCDCSSIKGNENFIIGGLNCDSYNGNYDITCGNAGCQGNNSSCIVIAGVGNTETLITYMNSSQIPSDISEIGFDSSLDVSSCICQEGRFGEFCELDIEDPVRYDPDENVCAMECKNGGTCFIEVTYESGINPFLKR